MARDSIRRSTQLTSVATAGTTVSFVAVAPEASLPILEARDNERSSREETLRSLKRFHLGGPVEAGDLEPAGRGLLPALFARLHDGQRLRHAFPLVLYPPPEEGETGNLLASLSNHLKAAAEALPPATDRGWVRQENLGRLEEHLSRVLEDTARPVAAAGVIERAGQILQDELGLDAVGRSRFAKELDVLRRALPPGTHLLGYSPHAAVHLLLHAARHRIIPRRKAFVTEVREASKQFRAWMEVARKTSPEASAPEAVEAAVGLAGSQHIDPVALAETLSRTRTAPSFTAERRERIETALARLDSFLKEGDEPLVSLAYDPSLSPSWLESDDGLDLVRAEDPCSVASPLFEKKAAGFAEVFRALRVARLELSESYVPAVHDPYFASFTWEAFSRPELLLLPVVVALESADHAARAGLPSFSALLRSGRPVPILIRVEPATNHGVAVEEDPLGQYRLELGYVGVSHREALVAQTSVALPEHLMQGFLQALEGTRTSVHLFTNGICDTAASDRLSRSLHAEAAVEGRAHPFFRYNPEAGLSLVRRLDLSQNPSPETDWPRYPLSYRDAGAGEEERRETLAFTFADFALLDPSLREHCRLAPVGFDREELVPVATYLDLPPGQLHKHLPFVWAVDENWRLRRAVVSRQLLLACQDRLSFWRTLQELAGARSEHAQAAAEAARRQALDEAAAEREKLEATHAEEIARLREDSASEAAQRLLAVLLSTDITKAPQTLVAPQAATVATQPAARAPAPAAAAEEKEVSDLPWIASALCTSCNDCMKINSVMFVYNQNKQAVISDPKAGTFKHLVLAAEKCPARCIHPGKPLDPKEPNLDKLIERAKPYN